MDDSAGKQTLIVSFAGYDAEGTEIMITAAATTDIDVMLKDAGDLGYITVINSRNLSRTRVETPVPVYFIPISQVINDIGQVQLSQELNFIAPFLQSARQPIAYGTVHVDLAQLRGL